MTDATQLRIIIAILGVLLLAGMYLFGQPKRPNQGSRTAPRRSPTGERIEPTIGSGEEDASHGLDPQIKMELDRLEQEVAAHRGAAAAPAVPATPARAPVGVRSETKVERIVTLYVAARAGETIGGPELVVAAEKAGLEFGDKHVFHRLVEGHPEKGPIFSVANMVKPGSFDLAHISSLRTPGVTFFMTLPGPLPALDAWDTMYPAAQRLAELLDAQVLDADHNAIGRQTIQHVRDDLRAWDRKRERNVIKRSW